MTFETLKHVANSAAISPMQRQAGATRSRSETMRLVYLARLRQTYAEHMRRSNSTAIELQTPCAWDTARSASACVASCQSPGYRASSTHWVNWQDPCGCAAPTRCPGVGYAMHPGRVVTESLFLRVPVLPSMPFRLLAGRGNKRGEAVSYPSPATLAQRRDPPGRNEATGELGQRVQDRSYRIFPSRSAERNTVPTR